jgi:uncharacterized protein YdaU (DUF1376 family)
VNPGQGESWGKTPRRVTSGQAFRQAVGAGKKPWKKVKPLAAAFYQQSGDNMIASLGETT